MVSAATLQEYRRALRRLGAPSEQIEATTRLILENCEMTEASPAPAPHVLSVADRRLVGEAIAASAEFFVTGDREIQEHAARLPITVIAPRDFLALLMAPR